jgi:hypothetical protein
MLNFTLLTATLEEAIRLSELSSGIYPPHFRYLWENGDTEWYVQRSFAAAVLFEELKNTNSIFYLVENQGVAIGFFKINIDAALGNHDKNKAMELERIYFGKKSRKRNPLAQSDGQQRVCDSVLSKKWF